MRNVLLLLGAAASLAPPAPRLARRDFGAAVLAGAAAAALPTRTRAADSATALFAGGDPRYLQAIFAARPGVVETSVGRVGGGRAVRVVYDPAQVSYKKLLGLYWRNTDPTDGGGQFRERGADYRPAIYVASDDERKMAETSSRMLAFSGIYGQGVPRGYVELKTAVLDAAGLSFRPSSPEDGDGDGELVGPGGAAEPAFKKAWAASGRAKFFDDKFKPIKTTACEGKVCGFVYFPCTPENGCSAVCNGSW